MNSCVAHRGWSGRAPENTMAAIRMVLNEPRIAWIEIDVRLSKDGVPVVIHDDRINRTTNGVGNVADMTFEQLRRHDAGGWFSPKFAGERIPSLEEVLLAVQEQGICRLNIELKSPSGTEARLAQQVVALVRKYAMEQSVIVTSFNAAAIKAVKLLRPAIETGLIIDSYPSDLLKRLNDLGATYLSMKYKYVTAALAAQWIESGGQLIAWTVNDPLRIWRCRKLHPELMVCTNYPDRWLMTADHDHKKQAEQARRRRLSWLLRLFGRSD